VRHGDRVKKLGREAGHRQALLRNLVTALIKYERIRTTVAKAKEARRFAERLVSKAVSGTLTDRREVLRFITDKVLVRKLFNEIVPRLTDRRGGYTRIYRIGHRSGDSAEMAYLEFVVRGEKKGSEKEKDEGKKKSKELKRKRETSKKKSV